MNKLLVSVIALLIAGCAPKLPVATLVPTATLSQTSTELPPTLTSTSTSEPISTAVPLSGAVACIPTGTSSEVATVTRVIDGDTIVVAIEGAEFRVRYIGIDTPEQGYPYFGEATAKNAELVEGETVTLIWDVSPTDQFDRLLRYVLVEGSFVNFELVRQGYALASNYPPDVACSVSLAEAQDLAAAEGLGLWMATSTPLPPPTRLPVATEAPPQSNCDPSYPTVCIPRYPPDLDCGDISFRRFQVVGSDPHGFDRDNDGIGCES